MLLKIAKALRADARRLFHTATLDPGPEQLGFSSQGVARAGLTNVPACLTCPLDPMSVSETRGVRGGWTGLHAKRVEYMQLDCELSTEDLCSNAGNLRLEG